MRYAQQKKGQKLHIVYEINGQLTQPICGRKVDNYRMNINLPMGNSCKNCNRRLNSKKFNPNEFIISQLKNNQ